jgi:penicillin-binding protein 2
MGIGQGYMTATPLQIAVAYAALANKGEIVQPRIIEKIGNSETVKISKNNVFLSDDKNWKRIEEALLAVVEASNGTANNIYDRNIRIAGKTGTAQVKSIGETQYKLLREDKSLRDHALFVMYKLFLFITFSNNFFLTKDIYLYFFYDYFSFLK